MTSPIITVKHLCKDYTVNLKKGGLKGSLQSLFHKEKKIVHAVKDVNMSISQGELVGYIGTNGAGKSTTIKMLSGILEPSSGSVSVCGINPHKKRIENAMNIGAVFGQKTQLLWDLPVCETFELLRRMYNIPQATYKDNIAEFTQYLDMAKFIDQPVRQLSLGQRMRAEIAASLMHNPKVLFLDEPTIGLDVSVKLSVREFIQKINKERKVTVLLTTHDLQDIEQLAQRIIIINNGTIGFDGSMSELLNAYSNGQKTVNVKLQTDVPSIILTDKIMSECAITKNGFDVIIRHGNTIATSDVITDLMSKYDITDIDIKGTQIEDVVLEVYRK